MPAKARELQRSRHAVCGTRVPVRASPTLYVLSKVHGSQALGPRASGPPTRDLGIESLSSRMLRFGRLMLKPNWTCLQLRRVSPGFHEDESMFSWRPRLHCTL